MAAAIVRLALAALAASAACAACSLIIDGDDYRGGVAAAPPDVPTTDAAADGDPNAEPDADAAAADAGFSCMRYMPAPTFCDDFTRSGVLGSWDALVGGESRNATIEIASGELHVKAGVMSGSKPEAWLQKKFNVASKIRYAFDVKLVSHGSQGYTNSSHIRGVPPGFLVAEVFLRVKPTGEVIQSAGSRLQDGAAKSDEVSLASPAILGEWVHYQIEVVLGATPSYSLSYGDRTVTDRALVPTSAWVAGQWQVSVGLLFSEVIETGFEAHFDNVAVWVD